MARGGVRKNAGRKKGETYHTRARKEAHRKAVERATNEGDTPLEYMLNVMRNPDADDKRRDAMAAAAAPFIHARLSNATVTTTVKKSVDELTTAELIAALQQGASGDRTSAAEAGDTESDRVH